MTIFELIVTILTLLWYSATCFPVRVPWLQSIYSCFWLFFFVHVQKRHYWYFHFEIFCHRRSHDIDFVETYWNIDDFTNFLRLFSAVFLLHMHRNSNSDLWPQFWQWHWILQPQFLHGVKNFDERKAFIVVFGYFYVCIHRNSIIPTSSLKSVVSIIFSNIDFLCKVGKLAIWQCFGWFLAMFLRGPIVS